MDLRTMEPTSVSVRNIPNRPRVSVSRSDGLPRYCEVCRCSKPDRTHHCKDCNACVLKMDHHCPWIGGCVGHYNYKFFYLFTLYTMLYAIWTFSSGLPLIVQALVYRDIELDPEWVVLIVLAFLFGALLIGFVGAHTYYILKNETTIEHISQRPTEVRVDFDESGHNYEVVTMHYNEKLWDVGYVLNWRAVMGRNPWTWFVPLTGALGNGCSFPFNEAVYNKIVERAKHQRDSLEPSAAHFNLQR
ncbi:DHHC palmitoyltransferase-domain-containing protein [Syncephalastrum racemosum]|uniref:Palmitoyltransferase n=1 Tax=Syncephalastrum racemosum TaxID=13706 RepID=A0A1X2HM09_SYNRA|nr:DHHC palmitoyltransferase-domain-containing protein [Syncephalastrum racemosum]